MAPLKISTPPAQPTAAGRSFAGYNPTWCVGCGDFGIHIALQKSMKNQGLDPSKVQVMFGIGCSGNMNDFLNAYAMHGLHGRAIPNSIGAKLSNHELPTVVIAGDGDTYGEGGNHFMHGARGNHDITVIIHDNGVYGLTTGQASSTAHKGYKSKSTPKGVVDTPLNPLMLAIVQGATFVAQGFSFDPKLHELITKAMEHKGFSLVNILQPCATFNKVNTMQYYKEHSYHLPEDYNPTDRKAAIMKAMENTDAEEKFPLGVIYQEERPPYHALLTQLEKAPLNKRERFMGWEKLAKAFV